MQSATPPGSGGLFCSGRSESRRRRDRQHALATQWKTRDLIITAVLAVALGVLLVPYSALYVLVEGVLGQVGGMILLGLYYLAGILVAYIVRRPGAATIASVLAGLVEMLLGSPYGIDSVWLGLVQGLGAEVVFAAAGWKDWRLLILAIAAVMSGVFGLSLSTSSYGYFELAPLWQAALFLLRIPSASFWPVAGQGLGDAWRHRRAARHGFQKQ